MAIKRMSYLDLTPEARKKAGVKRQSYLKQILSDRSLPPEHRKMVEAEVKLVNDWMTGQVQSPIHHSVSVSESVTVEANTE